MTVTGVLVCKNQAHLCHLAVESSMHVCDDYILIDNDSIDDTYEVLQSLGDRYDVETTVEQQAGYYPPVLDDALNRADDLALRLEGDQVYLPDRLAECIDMMLPGRQLNAKVWLMRSRFDLEHNGTSFNAPHPFVYDASRDLGVRDPYKIPRGLDHVREEYPDPVGVNIRVNGPVERILRWVRQGWFNRPGKTLQEKWQLDGFSRPYSQHMSQEEYVYRLQDDSEAVPWPGDTLEEIGERLIEWDVETNCAPYEGPYPPALRQLLCQHDEVKGQPLFHDAPPEWIGCC